MNYRDPTKPPSPSTPPAPPANATGEAVNFEIVAYHNKGQTRRHFKGMAIVTEGGDMDVPGLLITALTEIRENRQFPEDLTSIEIKAHRTA